MANIYTYTETVWTYHNTTRVSDESFEFDGIGAYAETTILGEDLGGLDNDLFLRGNITPSQGKLTQGLCCRLDFYAKQKTGQDYWDIENHLIYLKGDKNGQINQKLSLIGFQGYFDHMVLRIEVMPDAELALDGTIELTDFVIDDVSLNVDLSPVMDAIEEQGEAAKLMNDLLGLMMGVYPSRVMQQDGSFIYYWHDQPLMAESTTIWRLDANVFAVSNDGGQTWTGQTSDGTVIAKMVYALQIQASQVILSDGSDIDETLGELSGHFGESGDFTLLENGYAAFVKRVTGSDPPVTGDYSTTEIDGGKIKANTVTANQINVVALDGTGELDSTGGTLKVSNLNGTVEISPSNPLKVTDKQGNFIGGLGVSGGTLGLVANMLTNDPNMNAYATIGYSDEGGVGISIYEEDRPDVYMGRLGSTFGILRDNQLRLELGYHTVLRDRNGVVRLLIATDDTYITDKNGAIRLWAQQDGDTFLQNDVNSHAIGVDNTGPYCTYNGSTTYFHNMSSGFGNDGTLPSGNLNNVMTSGVYTLSGSNSYTNGPTGMTHGTIIIAQSSSNFCVQMAWGNGTQSGASRYTTNGGATWSSWAK